MLYGIGNYTMGASEGAERQTMSSGGGGGGGGGVAAGFASVVGQLFPGGVPATISAARGGAVGPAGPVPSGGGGPSIGGMILPIAVVGLVLVGGFLVIKKMRKGRK